MGSMHLQNSQRQQHGLSPRLQHAVRLLQLPSMEFAQEVQAVLERNPFLDMADDEPVDDTAEPATPADAHAPDAEPDTVPAPLDDERDTWLGSAGTAEASHNGDADDSPMNRVAAETQLAAHLRSQLHVLPLPPRDMLLAEAVVDSLDDDGYLRLEDLDELIAVTNLLPAATPEELQIALRRVQSLEPAGVAARNVVECLLLQLDSIECDAERALARLIISEHLEGLATKDTSTLARALRKPVDAVAAACARIRRFDPRPGWRFGSAGIRYLTPDVTVKKVRGLWTVSLNPAIVPKVRLHKVYAEMFQRHQQAAHPELATQLREARWTLRNVEQRFATILGVAQAIVKHQHQFFDHGPLAMKPMGLREIADEVGVHESTVSRVTNSKYMATPLGVFELKYFFSRAMATPSGTAFSGTAIRELVKEMLDKERPGEPLSDVEISRLLAQQGFTVARRTVTKYRHLLRVEAVERRRAVGAA
ncbi:RNA polymerase factor sigma-54 [Sphaerotilaceae bacterium SBD11-9]